MGSTSRIQARNQTNQAMHRTPMKLMSMITKPLQIPTRLLLLAAMLTALRLPATSLPPLTLERAMDESGAFSRLRWASEPGLLYRLQSATNLAVASGANDNWSFSDALIADSTNAVLEIR